MDIGHPPAHVEHRSDVACSLRTGYTRDENSITGGLPMNTQVPNNGNTRRISEKGWVVIPQELRQKYGLVKGTRVRFVDYGGVMGIVPTSKDPIKTGFGMFKGRQLTQRLLEERKKDREIEP